MYVCVDRGTDLHNKFNIPSWYCRGEKRRYPLAVGFCGANPPDECDNIIIAIKN